MIRKVSTSILLHRPKSSVCSLNTKDIAHGTTRNCGSGLQQAIRIVHIPKTGGHRTPATTAKWQKGC